MFPPGLDARAVKDDARDQVRKGVEADHTRVAAVFRGGVRGPVTLEDVGRHELEEFHLAVRGEREPPGRRHRHRTVELQPGRVLVGSRVGSERLDIQVSVRRDRTAQRGGAAGALLDIDAFARVGRGAGEVDRRGRAVADDDAADLRAR